MIKVYLIRNISTNTIPCGFFKEEDRVEFLDSLNEDIELSKMEGITPIFDSAIEALEYFRIGEKDDPN